MSLSSKRYVLFGFSQELDWRPLQFVEPVPTDRMCSACGLLPRTTVCLPCRHVLCKTCYEQSSVNDGYECPFDGERSREEDAAYVDFPLENLLSRKVKCWNMNNGCDAVMNASEILRHFDRDCVRHSAQCPECSTLVLHRDACKHRRSRCGSHAEPSRVQDLELSEDSVDEVTFTELEATLKKRVEDIRCGFDQVVHDHTTVCARLNEISRAMNKLNETVMQTSEGQTCATTDAITASVGEVKEDQAEHSEVLQEVSQRMQALIEHVETVAAIEAKWCLEKLQQAYLELMRSCARDDSRFESISTGISTFVGLLDRSLVRTTNTMSGEPRTKNDPNAASKSGCAASDQNKLSVSELHAQNTIRITQYVFYARGLRALKEQAMCTGWARYSAEPLYLCGYRLSLGLLMKKHGSSVLVHACIQLNKGIIDEFLEWPFSYYVKLVFPHSSPDKTIEIVQSTPSGFKSFFRPNKDCNVEFYFTDIRICLEELERQGFIKSDELLVKYELLPRTM